ncbi:MAG: Transcriptional regulator (Modular protein) [Nitrospira sp.]|nr:MAG: Transcriptional regulator (Modular protein) [Nitrospira sp.]
MRSSPTQRQQISENSLCGEFPFIRQGRSSTISPAIRKTSEPPSAESLTRASSSNIPRRFPAEIFADLTRKEMQDVLEILHYSITATTGDDVHQVLTLLKKAVACPKVIGGVAQLTEKGEFKEFNSVINVSYSNEWLYAYGKNEYAQVDPVLKTALSTLQTQVWEQTYSGVSSPKQLEFVEEARAFGLIHGLTTGMIEPTRNYATFFSFSGGRSDNTVRYKSLLEYLLPYIHNVLIANTHTPLSNRVKGLSPREAAVLVWMKQGKTNWEISRILGVSERTIRFHVESIFSKLDVSSRTQAVAYAVEHGLASGK